MSIDHISLQVVLALLALPICAVMFTSWTISRKDGFLVTGTFGLAVLMAGIALFLLYIGAGRAFLALPAFALILIALATIEGAGWQFATGNAPWRRLAVTGGASVTLVSPFFFYGADGLGIILFNVLAGGLLCATGGRYWTCRQEAPGLIKGLITLYILVGMSFFLCAVVVLFESPIYRVRAPNNWAENLNALFCIVGLAGIGTISLLLHQFRLVRALEIDARTDPLTGLNNRRALLERYGDMKLPVGTAVTAFDLDHFKKVNDENGHAAGDAALRRFGQLLASYEDENTTAGRIGGEEFILVMENLSRAPAIAKVEEIRRLFPSLSVRTKAGAIHCTVSAGLSFATRSKSSFHALMDEADTALYQAKRKGRDCVVISGLPIAA